MESYNFLCPNSKDTQIQDSLMVGPGGAVLMGQNSKKEKYIISLKDELFLPSLYHYLR